MAGWVREGLLRFSGQDIHREWFDTHPLSLGETLDDFSSLATLPKGFDWLDLYHYTQKIRKEGYNSIPYEVELNVRAAAPVTTLILTLLGITLALRQGIHGGIAAGIGITLVVASFYMALTHVGSSLSIAGILPPIGRGMVRECDLRIAGPVSLAEGNRLVEAQKGRMREGVDAEQPSPDLRVRKP